MKRYFSMILSGVLALSLLAGCGGAKKTETPAPAAPAAEQKAESKTPTVDKIKKDGKLLIGTSPDYPPFESLDKDNKVIGFDMDIMEAVAKKLGVKLEIVQINFDGLISALNAKKFDIMAAGVTVTEERQKAVDFSKPYLVGTDAVVVHKDGGLKVTKLEDLKGKKVGVQLGTVQADALKEISGITVKEYNLFTEAASAVGAKQADAMYLHAVVAKSFAKANPNLVIALETPAKDTAYALRKDTADLTAVVNEVLADLQKNGEMDKLVEKWFK
ncbi:MAG TPA: basic amino acid ABC transporter substrate-binding protein [Symbiobacteriaceae bacterium]|nr:basic amino acid ABC transporter substrate-binding protein [Symbiobacteriaceae bacterium]